MRLPSPRFLIGLVLVLVVCVVTAVLVARRGGDGGARPEQITMTCIGGSEKTELMADPRVRTILHDRYGLTVTFIPQGSYDQVQIPAEDLQARGVNCLWPASASAQNVFESRNQGAFPQYRSETVLQSPEVVYAGPQGTDALIRAGLVERRDQRYFIVDFKALLLDYVLKHRTWESLDAGELRGPLTVASTDPAKSNSGFILAQLQLNIIATEDVFAAPGVAQARTALPTIRALYDAQGLQARSSDPGFRQWILQGGEFHAPLYASYESQIIQQLGSAGDGRKTLLDNVRLLYPEPTIYSDHPILALDDRAARFIDAMKDPQIQSIAWKTYGFRSGTEIGLTDVGDFPDVPLAPRFRTTTPPNAEVTLLLLACMNDATTCR